jgi:Ca-activated chloride channel family protein
MKSMMTAPVLEPVGKGRVALQSINVAAQIENLLCAVTVQQVYRNLEEVNIEAVYTFPLPLGAVLLNMTIKTGTRVLKGVVVEKAQAEERYEEAITDGDTAIMLEQAEPGLYTMNVGNLQPGQTIDIAITYAELFKWHDDTIRCFLPTTIAPRYGNPESAGLQPHQAPEYALAAENRFSITLSIRGALAGAAIQSPSHTVVIEKRDGLTLVSLPKGAARMDRDFVLNFALAAEEKNFACLEKDADGYVALASFYPRFPTVSAKMPRSITILVDCSGSMAGDAIAQARLALYEILALLRPEDRFNVICFGSAHRMLFAAPVPVDTGHLNKARHLLETMGADMGGTEIGNAVAAAIKGKVPGKISKEVLLITDGEVWEWEKVTAMAAGSGFRFFTVGVGSAVSEAFVQALAEVTGGACELVAPNEGMAEKIVRHFKRIYFPKAGNVKIIWPGQVRQTLPAQIASIFDGDTLHLFGRFKVEPEGDIQLQADLENGETYIQALPLRAKTDSGPGTDVAGTTSRMAAACEIRTMADAEKIAALGVQYQLMSRHTNYLAIDVKEAEGKAKALPSLRITPQMLAAGWGGTGGILQKMRSPYPAAAPISLRSMVAASPASTFDGMVGQDTGDERLDHLLGRLDAESLFTLSIDDLSASGVPERVLERLVDLKNEGIEENSIVIVFLYLLSREKRVEKKVPRSTQRVLTKAFKQVTGVSDEARQRIVAAIAWYV